MTDQPTCETCRFWFGSAWDECRRRPRIPVIFTDDARGPGHDTPSMFARGIRSYYQFPHARPYDWCGEHEPVVEAAPTVGPWRDAETDERSAALERAELLEEIVALKEIVATTTDAVNTALRDFGAEECVNPWGFCVLRDSVHRIVYAANRKIERLCAERDELIRQRDGEGG